MRIPIYLVFGVTVLAGASLAVGQGQVLRHVSVPNRDTPVRLEITVKSDDGLSGFGNVQQAGGVHPIQSSKGFRTTHVSQKCSSYDGCCASDCCGGCGGLCGRGAGHAQFVRGLFCGPGNMYQHTPYMAVPKTYYYFRPYNYMAIATQQAQAQAWGAAAGTPYSNEIFQEVYKQFEDTEVLISPPVR